MNHQVNSFLEQILGEYKLSSNVEAYFHCPKCNHPKKKLNINLDTYEWKCWICDQQNGMRGKNLFVLLNKLNLRDKYEYLNDILGMNHDLKSVFKNAKLQTDEIFLPSNFISFKNAKKTVYCKKALSYLNSRGITTFDIIKYNIGYSEEGIYSGYIIIPSYDCDGKLNYFITRNFLKSSVRYKNPPFSKDIIFNDVHINWNQSIVLCEGVFDAISIRKNAIPLLGKKIQSYLKLKILKNKLSEIILCLDSDAIKDSIYTLETFMKNNIKVSFIEFPGKDPSEIGFKTVNKLIYNRKLFTFSDIIKLKMRNV